MTDRARNWSTPEDWHRYAVRYGAQLAHAQPLSVDVHRYSAPGKTGWDLHSGLELGLLLSGAEERIFSDAVLPVRQGDVWLTASWEPHDCCILESGTEALHLLFLPEFLGEASLAGVPWYSLFAVPPERRPRVRTPEARARVCAIAAEIRGEMEGEALGWKEAVRYEALRLLLFLRRDWAPPGGTGRADRGVPTSDLMRLLPALTAVHAGSDERFGLDRAAAACSLSASRFAVLFRRTMGVSFGRFSVRARVAQAAQRLVRTECTIEDVATQVGFADGSHLHRAFVKHFATTPAEYRRQFRG